MSTHGTGASLAEQEILRACRTGAQVDCGGLSAEERVVSGTFLRSLLLGQLDVQLDAAGLNVAGLAVAGTLDLSFCRDLPPIRFRSCRFDERPSLGVAHLAGVEFRRCDLPGLWADSAQIDYVLSLDGSVIDGEVSLVGADVGDLLTARGATINVPGGVALNATRSRIGGSVVLNKGFSSRGCVELALARVGGDVRLDDSSFICSRSETALRLSYAEVAGSVRGAPTTVGAVTLTHARIGGDLEIGGVIQGQDASGLDFIEADVAGAVTLFGKVEGTVCGYGSTIGDLVCRDATLLTPGGDALDLGRAVLRSNLDIRADTRVEGAISAIGATVGGGVLISGAVLRCEHGFALALDHSRVEGNISIGAKTEILGGLEFVEAEVSGGVLVTDTTIDGAGRPAVLGDRSHVDGNVRLGNGSGVVLRGTVSLAAAEIGGSLMMHGASVTAGSGDAADLRFARMRLGLLLRDSHLDGGMDLGGADAGGLEDDLGRGPDGLGSWSGARPLVLQGFTYRALAGDMAYDRRLREGWLRRTSVHEPQSWEQLEQAFRAAGRADDARRIGMAGQHDRARRGGLSWTGRIWRHFLGATIGHGYAPARAGAWGLGIILLFGLVAWLNIDMFVAVDAQQPGLAAHPQPFVYAADVFVPIIDFREADAWRPIDWMRGVQWAVIAAGWAVSTVFVAAFTRIVRG